MSFVKEFRDFAAKGNMTDLAVGVIIGGAFGKIVTSFVNDIIMPMIGVVLGGVNFVGLKITLKEAASDKIPAVTLNYGQFIQNMVDFLIIAFIIFLMIKLVTKLQKKKTSDLAAGALAQETPVLPPLPTKSEALLAEIRDLLAKK